MKLSPARRVDSFDALEKAGDYFLGQVEVEGEAIPQLWFLLPTHEGETMYDRPTEGSGLHGIASPPWEFRECHDGSVEARASILCGRTDDRPEGYWHGYLDEGNQWRQL